MTSEELRRLARVGAEARLAELEREIAAICQIFPDLRAGASRSRRASLVVATVAAVRRRPRLSRDARKRIADAQHRRWAAVRAAKAAAQSSGTAGGTAAKTAGKSPKKR